MARKFYVDQDECIACESCVEIAPGAFAMDQEIEKAYVKDVEGATQEEVEEAMDTCPVQCIHWEDE